jgi:hypothetical protein
VALTGVQALATSFLSGGAFSQFPCEAMTSWMAGATVCEGWLKVPGKILVSCPVL